MNFYENVLNWLFPKCWFCKVEGVRRFRPYTIHIKHEEGIEKVKICDKCVPAIYRAQSAMEKEKNGKKPV